MILKDGYGRHIEYIRISVTDRCNLDCKYCKPTDSIAHLRHADILSYEEIARFCQILAHAGVRHYRVTGGEPFMRLGVTGFLEKLCALDGVKSTGITTNGVLLEPHLPELARMSISSINISVDSLQRKRYKEITGSDSLDAIRRTISECVRLGLTVKINCVPIAGENDDESLDFVEFARAEGIAIRFIELMPIGFGATLTGVNNEKILAKILEKYPQMETIAPRGNGPAFYYGFPESTAAIGFISPIHRNFCQECNRVRLSADGFLKLCLASDKGIDVKAMLRSNMDDGEILAALAKQAYEKPLGHEFGRNAPREQKIMCQIGG